MTENNLNRCIRCFRNNEVFGAVSEEGDDVRQRLKSAIRQGHIWPAFQPIVDMRSGKLAGFEILARWSDPETGDISPATFIPLLERHSLIGSLMDALIRQACSKAVHWPGEFFLAFNVSPVQLVSRQAARRIARTVSGTGFPLSRIEIEVTEGALLPAQANKTLETFGSLGVSVSIDDFGTEYSNLSRLGSYPFSKVKIDARFVRSLDGDHVKRRIAAAIIGLGHSLGMAVVAEGVETAAELAILAELGCDFGQGWLYGKGVPAAEAETVLTRFGVMSKMLQPLDSSPFQRLHQLESLYRQAPVGLSFMDMQFRHVHANDRFARSMHGMTGRELEGRTVAEVMDLAMSRKAMRVLRRLLTDKPLPPQDYRIGDRHLRVYCEKVTDSGGEPIGFSAISIDVTDQNNAMKALAESEQHFRHSVELNPDVAWAAAPDGTLNYISPTFEDRRDDTMQQRINRWVARIHPDDRIRLHADWLGWIAQGMPYEANFRILWHDGSYRRVRSRARPYRAKDGTITRWYGVISNVEE